jgi:hypothetical protein
MEVAAVVHVTVEVDPFEKLAVVNMMDYCPKSKIQK